MTVSKISFIIPFRNMDNYRAVILDWHRARLFQLFPSAEVIVADSDPNKPFNRSAARNDGFKQSTGDIVFFNDADTTFDATNIYPTAELLQINTDIGWAYPFDTYCSLTPQSGRELLDSVPMLPSISSLNLECDFIFKDPTVDPNHAPPYSGLIAMRRESFEKIGGYDEGFEGWGFEDWAFKDAANYYLGDYTRVPGDVYHIWHPRTDCEDNALYRENQRRYEYLRASHDYDNWLVLR